MTVDEVISFAKLLINLNKILFKQFEEHSPPSNFVSYVKNIHNCIYSFSETILSDRASEMDFSQHGVTYDRIAEGTVNSIND